jgi:bifunctional non-homologous end joining protein LigD
VPAAARTLVKVGGRELSLSNLDKVLWPGDGYTKGDLINYYRSVAEWIVPHVRRRPLTMERYPNGIDEAAFWEKNAPRGLPPWVETVDVPSDDGRRKTIAFIVCNDEATLVYVANLASIVLHVWMSRIGSLDRPDYILFDLDPHQCPIATLARVAIRFRDMVREIDLEPLVKTTGGKGLHLVIPLAPRYTYETAKTFGELIARRVHDDIPDQTTLERTIAKRPKGTVMLDWVQVGEGKTMAAPFSVRPRPEAPVSWPLAWDEVEAMVRKRAPDTTQEMARWTIKNVPKLLAKDGDPWAGRGWREQRLEPAVKKARSLWGI